MFDFEVGENKTLKIQLQLKIQLKQNRGRVKEGGGRNRLDRILSPEKTVELALTSPTYFSSGFLLRWNFLTEVKGGSKLTPSVTRCVQI